MIMLEGLYSSFQSPLLLGEQMLNCGTVEVGIIPGFRVKVAVKMEGRSGEISILPLYIPLAGLPVTTSSPISVATQTGWPFSYSVPSIMASKFSLTIAHRYPDENSIVSFFDGGMGIGPPSVNCPYDARLTLSSRESL